MSADWWLQLLTAGAMAGGVYAAIRADLREAIVKATMAHDAANEAHKRIDRLQEQRKG